MKISSRIRAVVDILDTISTTRFPADKIVSHWNKNNRYAGAKDKSFIASLVYDILRNKMACIWWCEKYQTPVESTSIALVYIYFQKNNILQDCFFDTNNPFKLPDLSPQNTALLEKLHAHKGLYRDDMPDFVYCNVQQWMYPYFESIYAQQTRDILISLNQEAPVDIRVNTLKSSVAQVQQSLNQQGIKTTPIRGLDNGLRLQKRHNLSGLDIFKQGWFEIQDASSQRASKLVHAKRGDKIVDFCAGAGGKTLAIAEQMDNTGRIISCDISEKRLQRAKLRFKRAGVNNTECRVLSSETDKWVKRRNQRYDGGFDKVIVDAPCTGTGTWRRNPDQKWRTTQQDLSALLETQQRILQSASRLVVGTGGLIYMTCSLLEQENEHQIEIFLKNNTHFELVNIANVWQDVFDSKCEKDTPTLRFQPYIDAYDNIYDGDGFFIAIMERKIT